MLRIPAPGEVVPPLVAPDRVKQADSGEAVVPHGQFRRQDDEAGWEAPAPEESGNSLERFLLPTLIGVGVVALAGTALVFLRPSGKKPAASHPAPQVAAPEVGKPSPPASAQPDPETLLREIEPVARGFVDAKSVAELGPYVRHPETTLPRIEHTHPDGKVASPGFIRMWDQGAIGFRDPMLTVSVVTREGNRELAFFKTPAGWKVDWESWQGWSEVPWAELKQRKPVKPVRMRARVKAVDYYNFGFTDEKKWHSFGLESPDANSLFYGYVERGSDADIVLSRVGAGESQPMVLELHFDPSAEARNQVIIDRVAAEGWVELQEPGTENR